MVESLLVSIVIFRHLLEELQVEQRAVAREEAQAQHDNPGSEVLEQIEQLQQQLDDAKVAAARDTAAGSQLDKEVSNTSHFPCSLPTSSLYDLHRWSCWRL